VEGFSRRWVLDRQFRPDMEKLQRQKKLRGWHNAVRRTLSVQ
jgi:glycerol kinase